MKALKYNFKLHKYSSYELPEGSKLVGDLEEFIPCASCGKRHPYGYMYTSRQIHNEMGFGYAVCQQCYEKEYKEKEKYERR